VFNNLIPSIMLFNASYCTQLHLVYLDELQLAQGNQTTHYPLSRRLTTQYLDRTCILMFKSGSCSAECKSSHFPFLSTSRGPACGQLEGWSVTVWARFHVCVCHRDPTTLQVRDSDTPLWCNCCGSRGFHPSARLENTDAIHLRYRSTRSLKPQTPTSGCLNIDNTPVYPRWRNSMLVDQGYTNYQISGFHLKILGARRLSRSTLNTQQTVHNLKFLETGILCIPAWKNSISFDVPIISRILISRRMWHAWKRRYCREFWRNETVWKTQIQMGK
jgi:hypothetical protein